MKTDWERNHCHVTGKRSFKKEYIAKRAIVLIRQRAESFGLQTPVPKYTYKCRHCHKWHLTRQPPREKPNRSIKAS